MAINLGVKVTVNHYTLPKPGAGTPWLIDLYRELARQERNQMIQLEIKPTNFPCTLEECPPGPFVWEREGTRLLAFKSQYRNSAGEPEAFNEAGESFCGDTLVTPVEMVEVVH